MLGRCNCESVNHENVRPTHFEDGRKTHKGHKYMKHAVLTHVAMYVGPICQWCATNCLYGYVFAELFTGPDGRLAMRYIKDCDDEGIAKGSELYYDTNNEKVER